MNRARGFTLIELLITMSLLGMLVFAGSYAYSLVSSRWDKELGNFTESARFAKHLGLVQRLLEGLQPFVVTDGEKVPAQFFVGGSESLLAVSRYNAFARDPFDKVPVIFRLTRVENDEGGYDLVYQSTSTRDTLLIDTAQSIEFDVKIVLLSGLDEIRFRYFGWPSYETKNSHDPQFAVQQVKRWFDRYSGLDNKLIPEKMTLQLVEGGKQITLPIMLDPESERWLLSYMDTQI